MKVLLRITTGKLVRLKIEGICEPRTRPTRQMLRQSLIHFIGEDFIKNAKVLDLYAGSGIVGFEFLSNNAFSVTFVDISKKACFLIKNAIEKLNRPFAGEVSDSPEFLNFGNRKKFDLKKQTKVVCEDSFEFLIKSYNKKEEFDIIFIDPPFIKLKDLSENDQKEFICDLLSRAGALLSKTSLIILKHPFSLEIKLPSNLQIFETRKYGLNNLSYLIPSCIKIYK